MKKQILTMMVAGIISITIANAQGGGQRMTAEERTKAVVEKMAPMKMDEATKLKAEKIILAFNKDQETALEEMRASGSFDREAFGAKRKELSDKRDASLKLILTADQLKSWIDDVEPSTRFQRGGGGK